MGLLPKSWNSIDDWFGGSSEPATTISVPVTNTPENNQPFTPTNNNIIDTNALGQGLTDIAQANLILGTYQIALDQEKAKMGLAGQGAVIQNENARYKYIGSIVLILGVGFILTRGKK